MASYPRGANSLSDRVAVAYVGRIPPVLAPTRHDMRHTFRSSCAALSLTLALPLGAQTRAPIYTPGALNANQQLAHDVYKELIEIQTGVATGNITLAANAMAKRFRDAGIPERDIFVGGPRPEKFNVVARIYGKGG